MPISPIVLQRRHAELGRIRLGDQIPAGDSGRTRPNKLDRFRFTSVSERYIRDLATLYGGEPRPWDNGGIASWEVYTDARSVPVIVVKGGLSQWMEFWSGGGCIHRCDGENNVLTGERCDLEEQVQVGRKKVNPHAEAKPTTRLSVMLVELEAIGVWRCETHGWNAAAEIPAVAELAQFVGDLVPANLHLVERRSIKDGQTSRFVVPVLDLQIGTERLKEIVAQKSGQAAPAELGGGDRPALAAAGLDPYAEYMGRLEEATSVEDLRGIWTDAVAEHLVGTASQASPARSTFFAAYEAKGTELKAASPAAAAEPQPNEDGTYDADVVEADSVDDGDAVWQQILAAAGNKHGWQLGQVQDDFTQRMGGMIPSDATAGELRVYLEKLLADEDTTAVAS